MPAEVGSTETLRRAYIIRKTGAFYQHLVLVVTIYAPHHILVNSAPVFDPLHFYLRSALVSGLKVLV